MGKICMPAENKSIGLEEIRELFLKKCAVKNLSAVTVKDYATKLEEFFQYAGDIKAQEVSADTVESFVVWLKKEKACNDISINSYLRTLRAFLYFCMDCGYVKAFKVHLIKAEKPVKETYTESELEKLLEKPELNKCSFAELRAWAFINYLVATGNRVSSAVNLKIKDISFEEGLIYIRKTKNRRQQIIPLSRSLEEVLTEYLQFRGGEEEDYLFCDEYGEKAIARSYSQLVRRYNLSHGVLKTSCHSFRHTFAKSWIMNGGDVFRLQKILGHSDIAVTREYVEMFGADLQMDFEKYNVLDKMKLNDRKKIRM